jgi:hypothetical protein
VGNKKSGRGSKDNAELLQFRNALRGSKQPLAVINRARETLPPEFFREADSDALMLAARATAMLPTRPDSTERPLSLRLVAHAAGVIANDASASKDASALFKLGLT